LPVRVQDTGGNAGAHNVTVTGATNSVENPSSRGTFVTTASIVNNNACAEWMFDFVASKWRLTSYF
jgi:hypothetical protein